MSATNAAKMAKGLTSAFQTMGDEMSDTLLYTSKTIIKLLASPLMPMMGLTPQRNEAVQLFDNACGSAVFMQEIQGRINGLKPEVLAKSEFLCADNAQGMVEFVKKRIESEKWVNVTAKVLDAQNTGLPENSFSHVAACLALHITSDPDAVVKDAIRILKPGGVFGATTFPQGTNRKFWFRDLREAFAALPYDGRLPDDVPMQMHSSGHWYDDHWIASHLKELGLKNVSVEVKPGSYHIKNADEYVLAFSAMFSFMMKTFWSQEVREAHPVGEVTEFVRRFLDDKYKGEGWDIEWDVIYMTGTVEE